MACSFNNLLYKGFLSQDSEVGLSCKYRFAKAVAIINWAFLTLPTKNSWVQSSQQDLTLSKLLASLSVRSGDLDGLAEIPWSIVVETGCSLGKSGITKLGLGFIFLKKKIVPIWRLGQTCGD
jgi:hypothetical protein